MAMQIAETWSVSGFGVPAKAKKVRRPKTKRIDAESALRVYRGLAEVMANKFETEDVQGDLEALAAAEQYTREYEGTFDYMLQMKAALVQYKGLSFGQAKGVLNCLRAEVQREARKAQEQEQTQEAPQATPSKSEGIPDATYTVVLEDGSHVTLKITSGTERFGAGKQIASFLRGSDNENDYTSFAFVSGRKASIWKRFAEGFERQKEALDVLLNGDALEAGKRYAMISGKCCVCGRKLTDPTSIEAGIGPVCLGKFS